jgi:chitinase
MRDVRKATPRRLEVRGLFLGAALTLGACATPNPSSLTPPNAPPPSSQPSRWVMGYYVSYLADRQPIQDIDWQGLTHVIAGYNTPGTDGSIDFGMDARTRAELVRSAHANGRRALAMIGGIETGDEWLEASSGANRVRFVENLKKLVLEEGFDGLDLDWEPLEKNHEPVLLSLVKALRQALPNAILTFPADGFDNANQPADRTFFAQLEPYVDRINLMTYNMGMTFSGWKTWHSSPLYFADYDAPTSIEHTLSQYLKAGVPAAKLGIGIGFYGQCYSAPATAPLQDTVGRDPNGSRSLDSDNNFSYASIVTEYAAQGERSWDATARVPYLSFPKPVGPGGCTYMSFDDEQSILEKGRFVKENGLGGAILWNINQGYIPGHTPANPLLEATRRAFLEQP